MKQSILAAYLGIFIIFVMSFFLGEAPRIPVPSSSPTISIAASPSPVSTPETAETQTPQTIRVKHGEEIHDAGLEEYLVGVLAAEMPADFEPEALKAQAVAARSYTLYCARSGKHGEAQVCTDFSCCQAWKSEEEMRSSWGENFEEKHKKISDAVYDTAGEYLVYEGEPIFAAFHSSSSGLTESCGAIWSELPYLVSVTSPESKDNVPGYISHVEVSPLDFRDTLLHACPQADFSGSESTWIGSVNPEKSGRVDSAELGGVLYSGTKLRELFSLRSTAFTLEYTGESFLFTVTGFGHGVGMSQYGAEVMAAEGSDYTAILAHYYPGTSLVS